MDQKAKTEELMTQYLLGRLSEEERAQVEQEFFANNEYFEELLSVEDALIDRYLLGDLSSDDREAFEGFLRSSPHQWQELGLARDLIDTVSKKSSSKKKGALLPDLNSQTRPPLSLLARLQTRAQPLSTIALFVVLTLGLSLLAWNLYLLPRKMQAEAELEEAKRINLEMEQRNIEEKERSEKIAKELEEEKAKNKQAEQLIAQLQNPAQDVIVRIKLLPDAMSRSAGSLKVVNIKPDVDKVQLLLDFKANADYKQYSASIKSFEGNEVWRSNLLDSKQLRRGSLVLMVPASVFSKNDYTVTLSGMSEERGAVEIADYSFRVDR